MGNAPSSQTAAIIACSRDASPVFVSQCVTVTDHVTSSVAPQPTSSWSSAGHPPTLPAARGKNGAHWWSVALVISSLLSLWVAPPSGLFSPSLSSPSARC